MVVIDLITRLRILLDIQRPFKFIKLTGIFAFVALVIDKLAVIGIQILFVLKLHPCIGAQKFTHYFNIKIFRAIKFIHFLLLSIKHDKKDVLPAKHAHFDCLLHKTSFSLAESNVPLIFISYLIKVSMLPDHRIGCSIVFHILSDNFLLLIIESI